MTSEIMKKTMEIKDYIIRIKRHIHQYPELSMQEFKTTAFIKKELESMGIETVPLDTKVGVLGIIKGEKKGKDTVTALRADMDALPIQEQTGLLYASLNEGVMHACGHDCHTAMLLGAAKLLNSMRDKFSGIVKFVFQPSEERLGGSSLMIEAGVLENPKVDTIIALHGTSDHDVGKVALWSGPYMASADNFTVKVIGKGGHGAYPHKSKDAILAVALVIVALQSIVSRQVDAIDSAVISICTVNGGKAFNIIPEEVTFSGNVRCQKSEVRNSIEEQMNQIIKGIVTSYGCNYELKYEYGLPPLTNNSEVVDMVSKATDQVLGEGNVEKIKKPAMGSEDFSKYLEKVPHGAFVRIGINKQGEERPVAHNSHFNFSDDALPVGVALLTQFVLNNNQ